MPAALCWPSLPAAPSASTPSPPFREGRLLRRPPLVPRPITRPVRRSLGEGGSPDLSAEASAKADHSITQHSVYLLDSIGELASLYREASLAFIGGSFATVGGHNPIEAWAQGVTVIVGPHTENFREVTSEGEARGFVKRVADAAALTRAFEAALADAPAQKSAGPARPRVRGGKPRRRASDGAGRLVSAAGRPVRPGRHAVNPLSSLYGQIVKKRAGLYASGRLRPHRLAAPVISVGNLTFGGTGKTPFVEFLARRLRFEGFRPAILSRGYGRRSRGVVVVSRGEGPLVPPETGGDEPVALARRLPGVAVVVGERRASAAREAALQGANLFLLDDGFQHLALARDVNLLLLDARDPFGGGKLPPGGRLREPLSAIERADAIVFTRIARGEPAEHAVGQVARLHPGAPIFHAAIRPDGLRDETGSPVDVGEVGRRRCVAVSGVAQPSRFAAALVELDLSPEETFVFADHHRYTDGDLKRIRQAADRTGAAMLVTTEKDAVKLAGRTSLPLVTVRLEVEISEAHFFPWLLDKLGERQS